jgi:hypothetical protein
VKYIMERTEMGHIIRETGSGKATIAPVELLEI